MNNKRARWAYCAIAMYAAFILWTLAVRYFDVKAIGPNGSSVGLASLNQFVHGLTRVNFDLYTLTDWLGLLPICFAIGFSLLGLGQWIKRKNLFKVDRCLLVLGGFYIAVAAAYFIFEKIVINYRPILINGCLEASYPSSTTVLVLCVMSTAIMQPDRCIARRSVKCFVRILIASFMIFMVVARLLSGVHWFSDIIGGVFLSFALVMTYKAVCEH
jgi:undecaprenyl-diphosphatase